MKSRNKGQVLVLVALALIALLGLAALGIDVGYMYSVRHELQRCADAGALAGASNFIEPGNEWSSNPSDPVMVEAEARARDYASRDYVLTSRLITASNDIAVTFPSQDRIRVTTQKTVPLFFARVFGRDNQVISATAVAEASVADTGVTCLKPWGIPLPWIDNGLGVPYDNNFKYDEGETVLPLTSLPDGYPIILKIGEPFNNPNNINNVSSLQQEAGHFFALSVCGDTGGNDYRDRIANQCLDNCAVDNGAALDLKTGNMVGPTKQGVDDLIALDPAAVYNTTTHQVTGSVMGDNNWMDSPRLVKVPLYDPNEVLHQGNTQMHVIGFGGFWLQGYNTSQGTVIGYYVKDSVVAASSTGPAPGPVLKTLRLVE